MRTDLSLKSTLVKPRIRIAPVCSKLWCVEPQGCQLWSGVDIPIDIHGTRILFIERWEGRPCRYPGDVKSGPDFTILRAQRRGLVWNENGRTTTKQQLEKAAHQTIQASLVGSTVPTTLRRPKKTPGRL